MSGIKVFSVTHFMILVIQISPVICHLFFCRATSINESAEVRYIVHLWQRGHALMTSCDNKGKGHKLREYVIQGLMTDICFIW